MKDSHDSHPPILGRCCRVELTESARHFDLDREPSLPPHAFSATLGYGSEC